MKIFKIVNCSRDVDNFMYDMFENIREQEYKIILEFLEQLKNNNITHMSWKVVQFDRLKKIWEDYVRTGVVRDERGVEQIKDDFLHILARLTASNELAGHGSRSFDEICEEQGLEIPEDAHFDFFNVFINTEFGVPVSDYGLPKLWTIAQDLATENNVNNKILLINQMLNVVHQRGDLASLFIQGGSQSLNQLEDQYSYEQSENQESENQEDFDIIDKTDKRNTESVGKS